MTIYPAIDIKGGRCVRLLQGKADQETVYNEDPAAVAAEFKAAGTEWIHVVDLDGAFAGAAQNSAVVARIAALGLKIQLGGGMRNRAAVEAAFAAGVTRVVIGTRAAESPEFIREMVDAYSDRIAVGIDAKDGLVAVRGWVATTELRALDFARDMSALGVGTLIYTDIGTDGMLTGPNLLAQEAMAQVVSAQVIASGGVSAPEDVVALQAIADRQPNLHGVIIGKAIYEGRVDLAKLLKA